MKRRIKLLLKSFICVTMAFIFVFANIGMVYGAGLSYGNSFSLRGTSTIAIDGNFSDWDSLPCSYEYNWDNSQNCWQWGVWIDGVCYKTEVGTYSTDVRHKMQLYCDGEYVYLHVVFSRDYPRINGSDYQFSVDGQMAAFSLNTIGGGDISSMTSYAPGVYPAEVRHRNTGLSFLGANGTNAFVKVNKGNINNEFEMRIPLEELHRQNNNINIETASVIEFFTPNLMYRKITAVGTSTAPMKFGGLCFGIVAIGFMWSKRKKNGTV